MTFLQELIRFLGLGGRLHLEWIASSEAPKFARVVTEFTEKIRTLGPSPLSGSGTVHKEVDQGGPLYAKHSEAVA